MRVSGTTILLTVTAVLAGCAISEPETAATGSTTQSVSTLNRLTFNRLTFNRLTFNRLTFNRLTFNRLTFNRLTFNSLDDLEATESGRDLLQYVARCALNEGDILVAKHDGETYEFPGLMGVAPEWEHRALEDAERRMVSACLISHVNAYGVSVPVSLRAIDAILATPDEMADFPVYEGTFFGDVFGGELEAYGCTGERLDVALQQSSYRGLRVCTDPGDDCQVVSVGSCHEVCETYHPRYGWTDCWANGTRYSETISAYLMDDLGTGNNQICDGGNNCSLQAGSGSCATLDCSDAFGCSARCNGRSTCSIDGSYANRLNSVITNDSLASVSCFQAQSSTIVCNNSRCDIGCNDAGKVEVKAEHQSLVEVGCRGAEECAVACSGSSQCDIDCTNAGECLSKMQCVDGASCLLQCDDGSDCGFSICEGELNQCEGGVVACNRPCP